ncbi:hypothetical protein OH76DRAFT_1363054 [Lentinus brumalis]|uniref:Ubiquinol-cytochrome c chaperone domain-containing protein n=1 Tax=Lentinus brumalis TaxID=2498619 RepID=A0A371CPS2_9APHY|nr:hypothetical protein OH76DRAFT_1363054 [Polyporus brumalis]
MLARRLRLSGLTTVSPHPAHALVRSLATHSAPENRDTPPHFAQQNQPPPPPQTWLARQIKQSPVAKQAFFRLLNLLGYGSAKQYAGRRAFAMYTNLCIPRPDEESHFWKQECHLPPTFQSWFTVTNLHVWLLTVRLRALPAPHGTHYIQGLIDHFFLDVEDRVRAVLQPASPNVLTPQHNLVPYTRPSDFYTIANGHNSRPRPRGKAPERLVTRQMKIFKEQWAGMGMSFDLGLVRSDAELAGAVWRNLLGARGAKGFAYPSDDADAQRYFRRTVNLAGGEVEKLEAIEKRGGLEAEEARDDGSGMHDHPPSEVDKYVAYPEVMAEVVEYVRRELVRLESIPDEAIIGKGEFGTESEGLQQMKFGPVRSQDGLVAALRASDS